MASHCGFLIDLYIFAVSCHRWSQDGINAMHASAQGGHIEVIKFLLPYFGARVHERDGIAYTMLHWAAQEAHCHLARYLIEVLTMDPQDRDKVCVWGAKYIQGLHTSCTCVHVLVCAVRHVTKRCHLDIFM